jgi:hypothetical protein
MTLAGSPLDLMRQPAETVLAETRIEERDGGTWVSGLCPYCWERHFFRAPPDRSTVVVRCPGGHLLRIASQTSAGARG